MNLVVVRHGQCEANEAGVVNGTGIDSELTDFGRNHLRTHMVPFLGRVADKYGSPAELLHSPVSRARQTAEIAANHFGGSVLRALGGLHERHLGVVEGVTIEQALGRIPDTAKITTEFTTYCEDPAYGFETFDGATSRASRVLGGLRETRSDDSTNWLFTHGDFALAIIAAHQGKGMAELIYEMYFKNGGVAVLDHDGEVVMNSDGVRIDAGVKT